jgi:hypothetical protein
MFTPEFGPRGGGVARTCSPECKSENNRRRWNGHARNYYERNREKVCAKVSAHGVADREKRNARVRDWVSRNRDHHNARRRKRHGGAASCHAAD